MSEQELEELRTTMLEHAFVFEDPHSYRCGVEDAFSALLKVLTAPAARRDAAG